MSESVTGASCEPVCSAALKGDSQGFSWTKPFVAQGVPWVNSLRYEYYDCDIESLSGDKKFDLVARRGMSSPYPITLLASRRRYAFWRSWNHISDNRENIVILRYVKSGAFSLTQCGTTLTVKAGQFVFSKCNVPFRWESLADDLSPTEYFSILLPPDLVLRHFPDGVPLKDCLSMPLDRCLAMPSLLSLLNDQGQYFERHVVEMLVGTLLKEAEEVAKQACVQIDTRKHICEKRLEDIIGYITLHVSNPDLSASIVARACGISPRYLCYLLKLKGTSFSELLWEERLKQTGKWLLALDTRHYTIAEIAYMNGFKTSAHFSRLFKNYWGCSPREFRQSGGKSAVSLHDRKAVRATVGDDSMLQEPADVASMDEPGDTNAQELMA
ncbi:helix-turn-helix transcriptional regulator [Trinickia violacea]|uniref:Helix-turn-helix transcriptional regulator n=1 Tax=Trinickia violacea TaxID=2571746 RepID=A0A4P8ISU5_9BURK|nr:AraC family transcriptional regulator [Trinickia violacea]QCP50353.1 helix-turn-helix transcriptional regulator [Trinickia violacea]